MYTTILVPLDGSKRAEAILPQVEDLAKRYQATVIFLQVLELPRLVDGHSSLYPAFEQQELEQWHQDAEIYLAARQGEFRENGIETKIRVVVGSVVHGIVNTAESEGVDLIAMSSHGRTGLARVFYGSVAAGVLQQVDRPLLLIRSLKDE